MVALRYQVSGGTTCQPPDSRPLSGKACFLPAPQRYPVAFPGISVKTSARDLPLEQLRRGHRCFAGRFKEMQLAALFLDPPPPVARVAAWVDNPRASPSTRPVPSVPAPYCKGHRLPCSCSGAFLFPPALFPGLSSPYGQKESPQTESEGCAVSGNVLLYGSATVQKNRTNPRGTHLTSPRTVRVSAFFTPQGCPLFPHSPEFEGLINGVPQDFASRGMHASFQETRWWISPVLNRL